MSPSPGSVPPASPFSLRAAELRIQVRVKPRASKSRIVGVREGALHVAIAAPPVDGAANLELVKTLAQSLGVAKSRVRLVSGQSGRDKVVAVEGLDEAEARAALDLD